MVVSKTKTTKMRINRLIFVFDEKNCPQKKGCAHEQDRYLERR